jgi:LuxR family maltose regulon positive regulatory protein
MSGIVVASAARTMSGSAPGVHAIVATRRDPPLRLHQLRLAGELAEIRAAQLRFTEDEARGRAVRGPAGGVR